ncbi:MAG: hypothetical protein U5K81_12915 [Trueperaceae bacterium]|nr:hypothetical protein [Trueperaceae bacterium]
MSLEEKVDSLRDLADYIEYQAADINPDNASEIRDAVAELRHLQANTQRMRAALEAISVHADAQDSREGRPTPARIALKALSSE